MTFVEAGEMVLVEEVFTHGDQKLLLVSMGARAEVRLIKKGKLHEVSHFIGKDALSLAKKVFGEKELEMVEENPPNLPMI